MSGAMEHGQFCPHGGVLPPAEGSPATLAGQAMGSTRARVRAATGLALGLWALNLVFEGLRGRLDAVLLAIAGGVAVASIALMWLAGRARTERTLGGFGSLYLIATSFAIAAFEQHAGLGAGLGGGVSWNAVWIAFFPLMVPCSPRHTLVKGLMAASATPIAFLAFVVLPGAPLPAPVELVALFAPVYVGALLAYVGAKHLDKLGAEITEARSVGTYELVKRLGQGGMGEVWEARHRLLARPVALKLIKAEDRPDSTQIARFRREARAMARLKSPHTVELFDFGATDDGRLFYAMELLEGMDLEALVAAHGPLPPARVVSVLQQAARSLGEAHRRGMVHRDVKPANLHLGRFGLSHDHLKVLDFGLVKSARAQDASLGPTLTADGRISGTPAYMAPESLVGDGEVDGRADVYALGCVAVFLLTGERLFEADDVIRAAVAHITEVPVPPSRRGVEVPADLEAVIMACLEKDPVRRPDAESLLEMLDALSVEEWTDDDARRWWASERPFAPARESESPSTPVDLPFRGPRPMMGHA